MCMYVCVHDAGTGHEHCLCSLWVCGDGTALLVRTDGRHWLCPGEIIAHPPTSSGVLSPKDFREALQGTVHILRRRRREPADRAPRTTSHHACTHANA